HLPIACVGFAVVVGAWGSSTALLLLPAYRTALPRDTADFVWFEVGGWGGALAAAVVGLVAFVAVAPWLTAIAGRLDVAFARWLLGPKSDEELAARVARAESDRRSAVVAA